MKTSYHDFVFPELKESPYLDNEFYLQRQIAFITSWYDKFLRLYIAPVTGIEKTLTMHIAVIRLAISRVINIAENAAEVL